MVLYAKTMASHKLFAYTISTFGPSAGCAFCLFIMSLWDHHEGRGMTIWIFPKRLELIAWLRESMSRRNLSSGSVFSLNLEEKTFLFFSSCSTPRKGICRSSRHLKPIYPSPNIYIKCWNRKKLALGMAPSSLNAASKITRSVIAAQYSSPVTTTFNVHCTLVCGVSAGCAAVAPSRTPHCSVYWPVQYTIIGPPLPRNTQ